MNGRKRYLFWDGGSISKQRKYKIKDEILHIYGGAYTVTEQTFNL